MVLRSKLGAVSSPLLLLEEDLEEEKSDWKEDKTSLAPTMGGVEGCMHDTVGSASHSSFISL
jgi:hypothetical protein